MRKTLAIFFVVGVVVPFSALSAVSDSRNDLEQDLSRIAPDLSGTVLVLAVTAVTCAVDNGILSFPDSLAVIDYSRPSTERRFWLFDLQNRRLILSDWVAHGRGSGENFADSFSNEPGSKASSLGLYSVGKAYQGRHGYSLRLYGLEKGVNDRAFERALVLHGADYVSTAFIKRRERLGRSWGCPVLSKAGAVRAIDQMRQGTAVLFVYYPDQGWLKHSPFLQGCARGF